MRTRTKRGATSMAAIAVTVSIALAGCGSSGASGDDDIVTVTSLTTMPAATNQAQPPESSPGTPAPASDAAGSQSNTGAPTSPAGPPAFQSSGKASNVQFTKLAPGQQPPQFILFSFDGAGSHEKWQRFMEIAAKTDSRFTGFLTGIYLLEDANKTAYTGPNYAPGKASVSFGGTRDEVANLVGDLNQAWDAGHEIGTHYNGHFCRGTSYPGDMWATEDWTNEIDQFKKFFTEYKQINGFGADFPTLKVPLESVKGGRTQCLEGEWDQLVPAWTKAGFTYDTSKQLSKKSGVSWPYQQDGIWEFEMPYVYSPAFVGPGYKSPNVMAMDYNFWVKANGGKNQPERAPEFTAMAKQTYDYMYDQAFNGNRAPLVIGNHFNNWSGNAFNPAIEQFMAEKCGAPETICATYQDVIHWLEIQDPQVLAELQARPAVATGP